MKKILAASAAALVLGVGIFGQTAFASIWEWIQVFDVVGCDAECQAGTVVTLKRNVQTNASYEETRAVWVAVVAGVTTTEPSVSYPSLYQIYWPCYATGTVNTSVWDVCDYTAVATSSYVGGPHVTSTVFFRATTKWDGCTSGSTLNPDPSCGDVYVRSRTIAP